MTKERRNEILDMMYDLYDRHFDTPYYNGLCSCLDFFLWVGRIDYEEFSFISYLMTDNRPFDGIEYSYWWPISDKESREEFIEKLKQLP